MATCVAASCYAELSSLWPNVVFYFNKECRLLSKAKSSAKSTNADNVPTQGWICCQLGAREHYSIPRGLHQRGLLAGLITDVWIPPESTLERVSRIVSERYKQRYDVRLYDANVVHWSLSSAAYEIRARLFSSANIWQRFIARNDWFQAKAVRYLQRLKKFQNPDFRPIVFAYSYAARNILEAARELGFPTVLGQIDPGPVEHEIVAKVRSRRGIEINDSQRVPELYWELWREECQLCDVLVVNSEWTCRALVQQGVPIEKIRVVPLAYDPPKQVSTFRRAFPRSFCRSRPLRILYLGSLIPRKGIYELLEAAALLKDEPVEFQLVGELGIDNVAEITDNSNVYYSGAVVRNKVHDFYKHADVFLFPTHSDGFGLTQLEAMAWGLPVISSGNCGDVVEHARNGIILPSVTPEAIAASINWFLTNAERLASMSNSASQRSKSFSAEHVVSRLLRCVNQ